MHHRNILLWVIVLGQGIGIGIGKEEDRGLGLDRDIIEIEIEGGGDLAPGKDIIIGAEGRDRDQGRVSVEGEAMQGIRGLKVLL